MARLTLGLETRIILLVGAIQFINILDFMIVMPLGPDFAAALGIPVADIGIVAGSYSAAAAVAGLIGSLFLDRFDRRKALACALAGLVGASVLSGLAVDATTLIAARVLAGLFGGPASALALAVIADMIPPERRGRAIGAVTSAFSVASVLGVPIGLELAHLGGWWLPFIAIGSTGLVVAGLAVLWLPPMTGHIAAVRADSGMFARWRSLRRPLLWLAFASTAAMTAAGFAVIPNIAAHLQDNLGFAREDLGLLYMAGGAVTFITVRLAGRLVDRFGAFATTVGITIGFIFVIVTGFIMAPPLLVPIPVLFVGFMLFNSARTVATQTNNSRVPGPTERAGFLALENATRHLSAALAALGASTLLTEAADGRLLGVDRVAMVSIAISLILLPLIWIVQRRVQATEARR